MEKNSIFIRSEYEGRKDLLIEQCQELLKRVKSEATIKYVQSDNIRKGFVVRFDCDVSESRLLKTKYLCDDASATVHSLTTSLVLLEAYPNDEGDFVADVRKQLLKIWNMKVLEVQKIPLSEQFPYIGTGKYVVILQVPEVEELEEFKAMGLPDDMVLELPSCDEKLKVKFYCRRCLKEGHVQSSCANQLDNHVSTTVLNQPSKRPLQESEVSNPRPKKSRGPEPEAVSIGERRNEVSTADVYPDLEIISVFEGNRRDGKTEPSATNYKNSKSIPDKFPTQPNNRITTPASDIIIPIGIREIMYGLPNPVLDVDTLEKLFNHTKKRSNVQLLITKTYTTNIEGLRHQLKDIVTNYYKPPVIGSQEDRDFVKWIEKFLERF
ncbi:hypothetical protein JTE90_023103 [Oedothorax gibbosus]|uniref:CCHC-type domain-containing protein n=1 Tax=Oedothorax gibbosus TaxID=931172 RepID=A0AAV6TY88_9ARAC|nr:hypothetical protein JTE90_023103 [Oedothorax gibbosus]